MTAEIENRSRVHVKEIQLSAMAGIYALGDDPKKDSLMLPMKLGQRVDAPTEADFSNFGGLGARQFWKLDSEVQVLSPRPYRTFITDRGSL